MEKIEFLESKFKSAFNEDQSQVLADVIFHSYTDLVKISDFNELKEITLDLKTAQLGTESKVNRLEEKLDRLEIKVDRLEIKVDQLEIRVNQLEIKVDRLEVKVDKLEKSVQNLARQIGGLSESFGGSLEDFALDLVPEVLENNWNMQVDSSNREDYVIGGKTIEIDLIIKGSIQDKPVVVLGEVKSNLTLEEAKKFFFLVELLKDTFEGELRVLFFGYRIKRDALEFIKDMGGFAVSTRGLLL